MDRDIATKYYDTKWFKIIILLDNVGLKYLLLNN